eukprot:TRINITY_DN61095_c0_g1_i1.p1 TRINITY_DN61095_c0_g1~~TRINITY_DN61095_c0_g1_i1.p1  ORF type:complete len:392 (+),score=95.76 TRINITY_DN61095_c0_g1_i1:88-1263(+)
MKPAVVCDTGTGVVKAGFAGEQEPSYMFPTMLGRPMLRSDSALSGGRRLNDVMFGWEADANRSSLAISRPIENGVVQNWDDLEAIWDYTFKKMGVDCSERRVVQTEAAMNPARNRERIVQVMFEKYGFEAVNVSVQAILALNSQGLKSGFVVDAGDGVTHLVPVTEGYLEPNLVRRVNLAGRHVTTHLMKLLQSNGHPLNSQADFETVREVKQKHCYVALDLAAERKLAAETTVVEKNYALPDGRVMRIGAERFMAPEVLFTPGLASEAEDKGLSELVYDTIMKSDINVRKDYFAHILLSGGTTMFPGFSSRLEKDLRRLYLEGVLKGDKDRARQFKCTVEDPPRRQHMVFQGGSIMASAQSPDSPWWISRAEYQEVGAKTVHRLIPTKLN